MKIHYSFVYFLLFALASQSALAYVGPGPALSMMGSALTLIIGVFLALFMVLFYPIRLMLKRRKKQNQGDNQPPAA